MCYAYRFELTNRFQCLRAQIIVVDRDIVATPAAMNITAFQELHR